MERRQRALVDKRYYTETYADVGSAGVDPYDHYMQHGWKEGRNPSAVFNTLYYRDVNLKGAIVNPLIDFVETSKLSKNTAPTPRSSDEFLAIQRALTADLFDSHFYSLQIGEVLTDPPLVHYLTTGWKKGVSPSKTFNINAYLLEHPFVKELECSPLYHFASQKRFNSGLQHRLKPGRPTEAAVTGVLSRKDRQLVKTVISKNFDADFYLRRYSDVRIAGADPLSHFIDYGWKEGRNPSPLFDCDYYLANNADAADENLNPFYHFITKGRAEGRRGSPVGSRLYPAMTAPPDSDWVDVQAAADVANAEYIVIIPVYKGYDETLASIHAVLKAPQKTLFALHVINDVSPDALLSVALEGFAAKGLFSYDRNEVNLGFVKTVNKGLRRFHDKEVILLNSDAKVSGDWIDRMDVHAKSSPRIATITPFSNNATICSYPVLNDNNLIEPGCTAEDLDAMAAACNRGRASEIPTGVGFCFYMSRASRSLIGLLDEESFGRGYGEENDFCLRALKAGLVNVLAEDIFVYHAGQVSFSAAPSNGFDEGQAALHAKHPEYSLRIKQHLQADDSAFGRMRLDLYRIAKLGPAGSFVFIYHALAGGIITHIKHLEDRLNETGIPVIHIRVGAGDRWGVEIRSKNKDGVFSPNLQAMPFHQTKDLLAEFFTWLSPKCIHVHSMVGFDWSATTGFLDLIAQSKVPYYVTLHDYSVLCHRNDLVRPNGKYCGLPDVTVCQSCVEKDRTYRDNCGPLERRQTYSSFLERAAGVLAPSEDIRDRMIGAGAAYRIDVRPHEQELSRVAVPRPQQAKIIDIVTIGAIGPHKGSRIILALAQDAKIRSLPLRFHIVGYSDLSEEMEAAGIIETGKYATDAEALERLAIIKPALAFIPSIWPETFCYTLSMAFRCEIPPVVFDIGAQASRVREANFGFVLPYELSEDMVRLNDKLCALPFQNSVLEALRSPEYDDMLTEYYNFG